MQVYRDVNQLQRRCRKEYYGHLFCVPYLFYRADHCCAANLTRPQVRMMRCAFHHTSNQSRTTVEYRKTSGIAATAKLIASSAYPPTNFLQQPTQKSRHIDIVAIPKICQVVRAVCHWKVPVERCILTSSLSAILYPFRLQNDTFTHVVSYNAGRKPILIYRRERHFRLYYLADFPTGRDSPVIALLIFRCGFKQSEVRPGTKSPVSTYTISPGTSSFASTSVMLPSRNTLQCGLLSCPKASSELSFFSLNSANLRIQITMENKLKHQANPHPCLKTI